MKRWMKVLLGLGTHGFLFYIPLFLGAVLTVILAANKSGDGGPPPELFKGVGVFALFAFFGLLPVLSIFAMPSFFWLRIHKHPVGEPSFGPKDSQ